MDDPNMTMEEYIKFVEEKARRRGRMFNWKTATYGKIRVDDGLYDLGSVDAEFPAIVIDDTVTPQDTLPCKSQVSTLVNNEIDFRISFDESDDEDYTIICDKNSFSYKMISVNDLQTDSENDNEKVMPSIPSPEPMTSYIDDLDFFKDFENEFPAIVYNDAQTSKSDLLTELILNLQYIDEFDLNDETSLSEYDEEEQNVLYFNDLFPFNIIRPDNLKSEKDNDKNDIDLTQSLLDNEIIHGSTMLFETSHDKGMLFHLIMNLCALFGVLLNPKQYYKDGDCAIMLRRPRYVFFALFLENWSPRMDMAYSHMAPFPPREQIHRFLIYEGLEYSDADITDFDARLARIHRREVHRVPIFNFGGLPDFMDEGLTTRMLMEHQDDQGVSLFTSRAWRRLFDIRGPLAGSARQIPDKGDLRDYYIGISSTRDFLGTTPSYTVIWDPILKLCHRLIACSIAGRSQAPKKVTMTDLIYLKGMDVDSVNIPYLLARDTGRINSYSPDLPVIDMAELVRLQICVEINDTWVWVAMGLERQPDAAAGAPPVAEDAPAVGEGDQAVPAPVPIFLPIFVGTFSVMTNFIVLEDMDAYRDEGMGDIIVGEPFLREVGIKTKRLEGIITLYNGDDEVSEKDVKNGISHAYQQLKGFYKGVLNLGPDYIRNAKTEEWLTRGHISMHEME
ncbi:hypothetical protein Tco_0548714 [Tanacetum coccineum]